MGIKTPKLYTGDRQLYTLHGGGVNYKQTNCGSPNGKRSMFGTLIHVDTFKTYVQLDLNTR